MSWNTWNNPVFRFLAVVVAICVAIRLAWLLIEPALPAIVVAAALLCVWRAWRWHRERW